MLSLSRRLFRFKTLSGRGFRRRALDSETSGYVSDKLVASMSLRSLLKPFAFSVAFTAGSFSVASVIQYERIRNIVENQLSDSLSVFSKSKIKNKSGELRNQINKWWNSLSNSQKIFVGILAANVAITVLWSVPNLKPFLTRNFTSTTVHLETNRCLPMFLSVFSHCSYWHLAANMFVLSSFCPIVVKALGPEQFLAFYCSSGVWSSFFSLVIRVARNQTASSLGASGAIMAIIGLICTEFPNTQLAVLFLPMLSFYAGNVLKCILAFETTGILLKWQIFDHAAHLSGALIGVLYAKYGTEYIWRRREKLVNYWHQFRGPINK